MTDKLIAYCPEIKELGGNGIYFLKEHHVNDLIAAALRREIVKRGEWEEFVRSFAWGIYVKDHGEHNTVGYFRWLTDPETFIRVAGEWVEREE